MTDILDFYFVKLPDGWQGAKLGKETDCVANIADVQGADVAIGASVNVTSLDAIAWQVWYMFDGTLYGVDNTTFPNKTGIVQVCASLIQPYAVGEYTDLKIIYDGKEYTSGTGCTNLTITTTSVSKKPSFLLPVGIIGAVAVGYIATRKRRRVR